jgi:hypothetical protein
MNTLELDARKAELPRHDLHLIDRDPWSTH